MSETKKFSTMHSLAICASVIALLSFFLPFLQIDFFVKLSLSGIEFIGAAIEEGRVQASISVLSPILCVVGIICAIKAKKNNKAAVGTIVASAIGMIMMVVAMSDSEADIIVYIDYAALGFYLYEIMSLVAIVASFPILQMGASAHVNKEKIKINFPTITIPKPSIKPPVKPTETAKSICPKCKKTLGENVRFCRYCGTSLSDSKPTAPNPSPTPTTGPAKKEGKVICSHCGARLPVGTSNCKYCGTPMSGSFEYATTVVHKVNAVKKEGKVICPKCGARHIAGTANCKYCGTKLQ